MTKEKVLAQSDSVVKAFKLLEYFNTENEIWGVRELEKELNANTSITYRLMPNLSAPGVLKKRKRTAKYSIVKMFLSSLSTDEKMTYYNTSDFNMDYL